MNLVILGAGESGVGTAILGKQKGYDVFVSDKSAIAKKYKEVLLNNNIEFEEEQHSEEQHSAEQHLAEQQLEEQHSDESIHIQETNQSHSESQLEDRAAEPSDMQDPLESSVKTPAPLQKNEFNTESK